MKSFFKRLNRWIDAVIELENLRAQHGRLKLVTLKVVFENLRYYPLLAFLWVAMRLLRETDNWISRGGAALLWILTVGLGIFVVFQTSSILIAGVMTSASALLPMRTAAKWRRVLRKGGLALNIFAILLGLALISLVWLVGVGLTVALTRANLL